MRICFLFGAADTLVFPPLQMQQPSFRAPAGMTRLQNDNRTAGASPAQRGQADGA
jgi:hypothetical protein